MPEKEQNLCFEKDLPLQAICRERHQRTTDLFLDTSVMSVTAQHETFTGFRRALWSPPGMAAADSCLLATLSWDRRLRVYEVRTDRARLMVEISRQWTRHHAQPAAKAVKTMDDVRRRAYALSIIEMAWTPVTTDAGGARRCHLVTVTRSGQVAVWRLAAGADQARLVSYWSLSEPEDRVTCVTCLDSGVLLLGRLSGRLTGFGLGLGEEVTVTDPWPLVTDDDQLAVTSVVAAGCGADPVVLLAKGFAVVALRLALAGNTAAVTGSAFVRLEGAQVTGLSLLAPGRAVVSTLYNQICQLVVTGADGGLELTAAPTALLLDPVHYSCHALAASPNSAMVCTVERVFDYYDHLVLREPIRVSFTLLERPLDTLFNAALDTAAPLHRLADTLEAARLTMLVDRSPFSVAADEEMLARQSRRHLQCTLFMACASRAQRGQTAADADSAGMSEYTELLRGYLLRAHMAAALARADRAESAAAAAFARRAAALVALSSPGRLDELADVMPPCGVCQDRVARLTTLTAECHSGHRLPVCCQTLALCDAVPYRRCEQCGAFAVHSTQAETGVDLGPWCTFCDGRLSGPADRG
ncbi:uncharacterized protein LOC122367543 isoform X1 [Amphibalanus amphitrite]|nr:uncharacterized protein LOC122367543 isoform X1 [Amphibalanus amphitrite]